MEGMIPVLSAFVLMAAPMISVAQAGLTIHPDFAVEDSAGTAGPVLCADDIQPRASSASQASQIGVNAGQPVRMADARWFGIGTPIWDNYLDTPQTLTLLGKMGTQALRFPGGSVADQYNWYDNSDVAGGYLYGQSLASFIQVATNLNAETVITVNYGTGTPSEAAAWVAYVNAATNDAQYLGVDSKGTDWQTAGFWASVRAAAPLAVDDGMNFLRISRPQPLGFKYWEIGNELYGDWEADVNYVPHDPYTYAVRTQEYISLMKAVDPTIKIGVVACPGVDSYINNDYHPAYDPVTQQTYYGWTPVVLATLASLDVTPDFAVFHWYPEDPGFENDAYALQSSAALAANAADMRSQINDFLGANGAKVELLCTENNSDVADPGKQSVSLVNGLYKADCLGQLMQTEINGLFWHDFRDGVIEADGNMSPSLYGWRLFGDFGVATYTNVYPTYYTTELVQHFAQGGDMVVAAASDNPLLSVYSVRRQNGSLTMLVINKDPLNTCSTEVWLAGFTPAPSVTVYAYGIPQDTAAETGIGWQDITETNISVTGTTFSYSFPPYSATVMVLSPAPSIGPSTTAVAASQNPALAGSGVTLTASVSCYGGIPTGIVLFNDGDSNLGFATLNGSGMASLTTAALSAGGSPHSITAVYGGDGYYAGSTSGALSEVITNKTSVSTIGLSASWPFNEGSGSTVTDASGNGNTGTLEDSPVWVAGLKGGNALEFPGSLVPGAAYVSVPDSATLADQGIGSNITICAWVKRSPASIGDYSAVVAKDMPFDTFPYHRNYELIFDTDSHILFVYRNNTGSSWEMYASSQAFADTGNWHYFCVTYTYGNAASCALYVDGAAVPGSWVSGNGSDAPASTSGGPVLIGIDGAGTASCGSLYEGISIYSIHLSAPQVLMLYNSGISTGVASTTTLASSQNPAAAGSAVIFTATVSGSGGTPTGTVVFYDGSASLGSGTLNSSGVASLSASGLSASGSPHSITAVYGGDSTFDGTTSSVLLQIITNSGASTSSGGLSASWPFNEGSGTTVADASGNGNTGTLENSPLWVSGLGGHAALEFPGASMPGAAYVTVPGSATLADQGLGSQITICAWVKRSSASVGKYCSVVAKDVLYDSAPYHRNYELIFDTGGHLLFVYRNSAGTSWEMYASSAVFTDTAGWHFYCVTYTYGTAASCTLYVDGAEVSGGWIAGNGSDTPASTSGGPVLIGTDGTGTASNGSLYDDISIYNIILSASQVLGLYNSGTASGVASATAVASSQNPAAAGSAVIFTATVSGSGGTPTGTVVFYDGSASLGSGTLNSSGVASLSASGLSASGSPHSITAVYGGDSTFDGSTSSVLSQIITNSGSTVSIPLVNPSFEIPAGAQGTVAGKPAGWVASNGDPYGVYNPPTGLYNSEVNDILPSPAQGSQVLYIQGGNYLAQFLTNTLAPNQTYTLNGAIGNRGDGYGLLATDTDYVCLLAGGTILAQNANLAHPAPGTFLPWTISYTTGAAGFPSGTLEIRLGQSGAGQVQYDNITLTSVSSAGRVSSAAVASAANIRGAAPQIATGDASFGFVTGQFGFNVDGAFGQTIVVDGSTNLMDWTPLLTNSAGGNPFYFRDAASSNFARRFYRARQP